MPPVIIAAGVGAAAGGNLMLCQLTRGSVQIVRGCEL